MAGYERLENINEGTPNTNGGTPLRAVAANNEGRRIENNDEVPAELPINSLVKANNQGRPYRILIQPANIGNAKRITNITGDYSKLLGSESLYTVVKTLGQHTDTRTEEYDEALRDLIVMRLILSGQIQFRKSIFGSWNKTIGRKFAKLPDPRNISASQRERIDTLTSKILNDLETENFDRNSYSDLNTSINELILALIVVLGMGQMVAIATYYQMMHEFYTSAMATQGALTQMGVVDLFGFVLMATLQCMYIPDKFAKEDNFMLTTMIRLIDKYITLSRKAMHIITLPPDDFKLPKVLNKNDDTRAIYYSYINTLRRMSDKYSRTLIQIERAAAEAEAAAAGAEAGAGAGAEAGAGAGAGAGNNRTARQNKSRNRKHNRKTRRKTKI
jgi:hypothetical protein